MKVFGRVPGTVLEDLGELKQSLLNMIREVNVVTTIIGLVSTYIVALLTEATLYQIVGYVVGVLLIFAVPRYLPERRFIGIRLSRWSVVSGLAVVLFSFFIADPNTVVEDDFSNSARDWPTGPFEHGVEARYIPDREVYLAYDPADPPPENFDFSALAPGVGDLENVTAQVQGEWSSGDVPAHNGNVAHYGIMIRASEDLNHGVQFEIFQDGRAQIVRFDKGEPPTILAEGTFSDDVIRTEEGATNRIRASYIGDELVLESNGKHILRAENGDLKSGRVGLTAENTEVMFDDFKVSRPELAWVQELVTRFMRSFVRSS